MIESATQRFISAMGEIDATRMESKKKSLGRDMNPYTARDADLDRLVLEGIARVNSGRGIPDPTPFGNVGAMTRNQTPPARPENRLRRAVRRSMRDTPKRVARGTSSLRRYLESSDGVSGRMASERPIDQIFQNFKRVSIDEIRSGVNSVVGKVDSVMGQRPRTIGEILRNLKSLENLINGMNPDGSPTPNGENRNFRLLPLFFMASTQNALREAMGDRFDGEKTIPSKHDIGVYYATAYSMLENPEAFRDVDFIIQPMSMPDIFGHPGAEGSVSMVPSYYSFHARPPKSSVRRERGGGFDTSGVADTYVAFSPVKDYSEGLMINVTHNPRIVGGRLPVLMRLAMYGEEGDKETVVKGFIVPKSQTGERSVTEKFQETEFVHERRTGERATFQRLLKEANDFMDAYSEEISPSFVVETTGLDIVLSLIEEAQRIFKKANDALAEDPSVSPSMVEAMRDEGKRLIDLADMTASMALAFHEFGHFFDKVGDYKNSPAYPEASDTGGRGLNTAYEYRRDLAILESLKKGEPSPYLESVAEELMHGKVKNILKNFLTTYVDMTAALTAMERLSLVRSSLNPLIGDVAKLVNDNDGLAGWAWVKMVVTGQTKTVEDAVSTIKMAGLVKVNPDNSPSRVEAEARRIIGELRKIFSYGARGVAWDMRSRASRLLTPSAFAAQAMDNENFNSLLAKADDRQRAMMLAVMADALVRGYDDQLKTSIEATKERIIENERLFKGEGEVPDKYMGLRKNAWLSEWLSGQSFNVDGYVTGWSSLMSELISSNPDVVVEFLELFGRKNAIDGWFDADGSFSKKEFVKREIARKHVDQPSSYSPILHAINNAVNGRGYSGWKDLTDDESATLAAVIGKITQYADQTDYDMANPRPKHVQVSNAETYAELNAILSLNILSFLNGLTQRERDIALKLRSQMMSRVNEMRGRMLRNSRRLRTPEEQMRTPKEQR